MKWKYVSYFHDCWSVRFMTPDQFPRVCRSGMLLKPLVTCAFQHLSSFISAVGFCLAVGNLPGPLGQCQWPAVCVHWCGWRDHAHSCDKTVESSPLYWPACLNTCPHIAVSGALGAGGGGGGRGHCTVVLLSGTEVARPFRGRVQEC